MNKTCSGCKRFTDDFAKNKAKKDGLQTLCRKCVKEKNAEYYKRTPERNNARREYRRRTAEETKKYIFEYLSNHQCVDCGESDPIVLEFDHVRGDKRMNVSRLVAGGWSMKTLLDEIAKCEVRCANCHRRVTAQRGGWWRSLI